MGDKPHKGKDATRAVFRQFSSGLKTSRDAWCYNFSQASVATNMLRMINNYNDEVRAKTKADSLNTDPTRINWNRQLIRDLQANRIHKFNVSALYKSMYRPFCTQSAYFAREMNDMIYQLPQIFPTPKHRNLSITTSTDYRKPFSPFSTDLLPDLNSVGTPQIFPLYTWEPLSPTSGSEPDLFADLATASESRADGAATASSLDFSRPIGDQIPVILDGYRRVDNITDATLASYREHYGDAGITKEDIFFYVYALLHHPEYRERYEDDLKKMLPHIPRAAGFHTYASVGRELADLHVNYERVEPYPSVQEEASLHAPADPWERYRIGERKMRFPKLGRRDKDVTRLEYNDYVTLMGIPAQAQGYSISGRSPLEWIIDRYHVKTDKASGIVNDPNDFRLFAFWGVGVVLAWGRGLP
ncbi:type ISP restriction/modification enzyme, partial [uncultured Actinomyces sp.]|uniref:type ISP restriction/modification enzyme n=1 Tax=uncultured Actinomyces sp. TaxID=249061 RepID=UPI0028EA78F1